MLSKLKATLDKRYGPDWPELDVETISLDLGHALTPTMISQLMVLRTLGQHPEKFLNDASYFLRFVEAANSHLVDPSVVYMPNVLELAWGLIELKRILPEAELSNAIWTVCSYILRDEGFGSAPEPFTGVTGLNNPDETFEQKAARAKAIRLYALAMEEM
ncbi:hypothetical protein CRX22_11240 [Salmonella enterica subsp. enterica serovar Newport]|nr:hypothetical protein [Salmonella enterica subsp. enterica serovar Newport]